MMNDQAGEMRRFLDQLCAALDAGGPSGELPRWRYRAVPIAIGVAAVLGGCHRHGGSCEPGRSAEPGVPAEATGPLAPTHPESTGPLAPEPADAWPGASAPGSTSPAAPIATAPVDDGDTMPPSPPGDVVVKYGVPADLDPVEPAPPPPTAGTKYGGPPPGPPRALYSAPLE